MCSIGMDPRMLFSLPTPLPTALPILSTSGFEKYIILTNFILTGLITSP